MSTMLLELVGRRCSIRNDEEEYITGSPDIICSVTGADEDWIRVAYTDSLGNRISRMDRVESLSSIMIFEDFDEV